MTTELKYGECQHHNNLASCPICNGKNKFKTPILSSHPNTVSEEEIKRKANELYPFETHNEPVTSTSRHTTFEDINFNERESFIEGAKWVSSLPPKEDKAPNKEITIEQLKWLLYYGHTEFKTIELDIEDKGQIDYAIEQTFIMMKESTRFDFERVKAVFWERLLKITNNKFLSEFTPKEGVSDK